MARTEKRDWWESGSGLDLWSIPHFLFGVLVAMAVPLFLLPFWHTFATMTALAILWEVFEKYVDIKETPINQILDVVLSVVGFVLTAQALGMYPPPYHTLFAIFFGTFLIYGLLNILGWQAHRRRTRES